MRRWSVYPWVALVLVAFVYVLSAASPTMAALDPPGSYTYATGTTLAQAGVLARAGAATFGGAEAWNASGGTAYLMCFDRTTQPSTGTAPAWGSVSCASATFCPMATVPAAGIRMATGVYCAFSSTGPTYTQASGSSTGFYSITYR